VKTRTLVAALGSAAVSLLPGCAYNLRGTASEDALLDREQRSVAQRYFLPEHLLLLLSIPAHYAELPYDWAVGAAQKSTLEAMLGGYGYEPSIVYNISRKGTIPAEVMAHELFHQLVHRTEKASRIDQTAFIDALHRMAEESQDTRNVVGEIIHRTAAFRYTLLGLSEEEQLEETEAFMLQRIIKDPDRVPNYMKEVFRPILNEYALHPERLPER